MPEFKSNHCTCFPDTILGVYIGDCCKTHDHLYRIGGNARDRKKVDKLLRKCIMDKRVGGIARLTIAAYIAYYGVRIGSSKLFCKLLNEGQQRFNWSS